MIHSAARFFAWHCHGRPAEEDAGDLEEDASDQYTTDEHQRLCNRRAPASVAVATGKMLLLYKCLHKESCHILRSKLWQPTHAVCAGQMQQERPKNMSANLSPATAEQERGQRVWKRPVSTNISQLSSVLDVRIRMRVEASAKQKPKSGSDFGTGDTGGPVNHPPYGSFGVCSTAEPRGFGTSEPIKHTATKDSKHKFKKEPDHTKTTKTNRQNTSYKTD